MIKLLDGIILGDYEAVKKTMITGNIQPNAIVEFRGSKTRLFEVAVICSTLEIVLFLEELGGEVGGGSNPLLLAKKHDNEEVGLYFAEKMARESGING